MNTRGLFSNDSKVEFESNHHTDVLILARTIAAQGYTRKELTKQSHCAKHEHMPYVLDAKNQAHTNKMTTNALKYIELTIRVGKFRLCFFQPPTQKESSH